jgi:hypothetical protein
MVSGVTAVDESVELVDDAVGGIRILAGPGTDPLVALVLADPGWLRAAAIIVGEVGRSSS